MINCKSEREIELMRKAGRIVSEALCMAEDLAKSRVTTDTLNTELEKFVIQKGGKPVFKGYRGYPKSICTSINEEIVHGIPSQRILNDGDILSVDIGVEYSNYVADAAITIPIGEISQEMQNLLDVCHESLLKAIGVLRSKVKLSAVSRAIQTYVEAKGFSVVRDYTGHGIGRQMHEEPQIPNFVNNELLKNDKTLLKGMALAIEPMICVGGYATEVLKNNWTVVTKDRKFSAHYEHTVVITDDGADILTK
ncbi:MAG: type I methionyl aminopeptidase [Candidatus Scalindua sp. AMX11]|nr:MAG: type I methionyl aminopeptidase [Candidatus Scalindua sp.]NOG85508.1 type I methionyl aminopeptidase [Planctomycetota bacterium]RZV90243.1 MAG: type I methionyl aminopeptidase [Candidatus Scalindua sp. SCAELEC01]TDE64654.1 MAG: type I methionyl aminopeptidase [Candidatus Scalindua sp. AMX11]GJQ57509.1 MAG: type I methionyl aminopeptidase [Candidatus Scalindua sp.]